MSDHLTTEAYSLREKDSFGIGFVDKLEDGLSTLLKIEATTCL